MCESSGYDCSIDDTIHFNLLNGWVVKELDLVKHGEESKLYERNGNLYSFDPALSSQGPGSLLADKKIISDLGKKGYSVVWTWLGEKDILFGEHNSNKWQGRLEISAVSYFENNKWITHKNFKFNAP